MTQKRIPKEPAAKKPDPDAPKPRKRAAPGRSNAAATRAAQGGKALDAATRAKMEQSFGADFGAVRLHSGGDAQSAAQALDAQAFTQDDDIYLGADAPAPETAPGQSLIAHELTHVVQQREADAVDEAAVSQSGDRSELAAEQGAARATSGQAARVAGGSTVAGTQRQRKDDLSITKTYSFSRAEVIGMLTQYFQQQVAAQGGGIGVRITPAVELAVRKLFAGLDVGAQISAESVLKETTLRPPNELAQRIGKLLPDSVPGQNVGHLGAKPPSPDKPTFTDRVKDAAEKTAPAELPADVQQSQQRFDQEAKDLRRNDPGVVGPYSVDVLRIGRIAGELMKKPAAKPASTAPATFPAVEAAIKSIPASALAPPGVPADKVGDYADAQEVARELARQLDAAHQQKSADIVITLPQNYNALKDPSPIYRKLREIALMVKAALPHHAPGVTRMSVAFGDKVVQYVSLSASQSQ